MSKRSFSRLRRLRARVRLRSAVERLGASPRRHRCRRACSACSAQPGTSRRVRYPWYYDPRALTYASRTLAYYYPYTYYLSGYHGGYYRSGYYGGYRYGGVYRGATVMDTAAATLAADTAVATAVVDTAAALAVPWRIRGGYRGGSGGGSRGGSGGGPTDGGNVRTLLTTGCVRVPQYATHLLSWTTPAYHQPLDVQPNRGAARPPISEHINERLPANPTRLKNRVSALDTVQRCEITRLQNGPFTQRAPARLTR